MWFTTDATNAVALVTTVLALVSASPIVLLDEVGKIRRST